MRKSLSPELSSPHQPPKLALFPLQLCPAPGPPRSVLHLPSVTWHSFTLKSKDSEQLEVQRFLFPCPPSVFTANQLLNLPPCYFSSPSCYLKMLFSISSPWSRNMAELYLLSRKLIRASHRACFGQQKVGRADICCIWRKYLVVSPPYFFFLPLELTTFQMTEALLTWFQSKDSKSMYDGFVMWGRNKHLLN